MTLPSFVTTSGFDFDERGVGLDKRAIERRDQRAELPHLLVAQAKRKGDFARLEPGETNYRIDRLGENSFRRLGCYLFDFHTALGAGDDRDAFRLAIDDHAEIELAGHFTGLLEVDAPHDPAVGSGLMCHQRLIENLCGEISRL